MILVRTALEAATPGVLVTGALCMVDAELPMLGTLTFRGYPLLHRKALAKRLNEAGFLNTDQVRELAGELAQRFPSA